LKKLGRLKAFFRCAWLRKWIGENLSLVLRGPKSKRPG